jgi:hypothetical protein
MERVGERGECAYLEIFAPFNMRDSLEMVK